MDLRLQVKIDIALIVCRTVKRYLAAGGRAVWIPYFDAVEDALVAADVNRIQEARERIPIPNMGGFGEEIERDSELRARYRLLDTALGNIKVWHLYHIDRPLVVIPARFIL